MMNRSYGQQQKMILVTLESLMPEKHFLRDLDRIIRFDFVYEKVGHLYSNVGRRSIDPVVIVKMLLIGYLYGIDSERRLEQEIRVNIAYRWFLGIDLDEPDPDHSTFSQLRRRKFINSALFEEIFAEVVKSCIEHGLVDGKLLLTDSTHIKANAKDSAAEIVTVDVEPSEYLKRLNERAKQEGIYPKSQKKPKSAVTTKEVRKSITDPESGYMNRAGKPLGFYYLSHQTCDSLHGLITLQMFMLHPAIFLIAQYTQSEFSIKWRITGFLQARYALMEVMTAVKFTRICWTKESKLIYQRENHEQTTTVCFLQKCLNTSQKMMFSFAQKDRC